MILEQTLADVTAFREGLNSKITEEEHKIFFEILDKLEL